MENTAPLYNSLFYELRSNSVDKLHGHVSLQLNLLPQPGQVEWTGFFDLNIDFYHSVLIYWIEYIISLNIRLKLIWLNGLARSRRSAV